MNQRVLLYSNSCPWSKKLIQLFKQLPGVLETFNVFNIDVNPETNKRPDVFYKLCKAYNIQKIPVVILENGEIVYQGQETIDWINYVLQKETQKKQQQKEPESLQGISTDNFASLGEDNNILKSGNTTYQSLFNIDKTTWDGTKENFTENVLPDQNQKSCDDILAEKEKERQELDKLYSPPQAL